MTARWTVIPFIRLPRNRTWLVALKMRAAAGRVVRPVECDRVECDRVECDRVECNWKLLKDGRM